jgi:hypothetical protein
VEVRGYPAFAAAEIPGSRDQLVVVEYHDFRGSWPNLFRVTPEGDERWASAPPGGADAYVAAEVAGDEVVAHTHFGKVVRLDLQTGEVRQR